MEPWLINRILALVIVVVGMGCLTEIVKHIAKARATSARPQADLAELAKIAERLTRLETIAETTALEVERISEGQRFTTKLLAERAGEPLSRPPRAITPH
jgi:hypothetical protein